MEEGVGSEGGWRDRREGGSERGDRREEGERVERGEGD